MEKVSFCLMQIIVESQVGPERFTAPTKETFNNLEKQFSFICDGIYYEIECENHEDYLWLYFNYGKPSPRNEMVTNIETGCKTANLRQNDEAELLDQLFALYVYHDNVLYLSNTKKKKIVEQVLKDKIKQCFEIKFFYKSADDIIAILKRIDKIKFTNTCNLFTQDSKERKALIDLTGTDAPASFTIEASYNTHKIENFIRYLFKSQGNYQISNLVICGRDESDFSYIYNVDSFSRKIEVSCDKNKDSGLFNSDEVKLSLIHEIYDER